MRGRNAKHTVYDRRNVTTSADSAPRGQEEGGRYAQSLCQVTGARRFSSKRPGGVRRVCTDTGYDLSDDTAVS